VYGERQDDPDGRIDAARWTVVVRVTGPFWGLGVAVAGVDLLLVDRAVMLVTGVVLLGVAGYVYRRRSGPALWPFVVLVTVMGTLSVADGLLAGDIVTLSVVWLVAYLAIPAAFGWFVVEYYGLPYLATPGRRALYLAPAVLAAAGGIAIILEDPTAGAMFGAGSSPSGGTVLPRWGFFAAQIAEQVGFYYAGGVMVAATGLILRTTAAYEHLDVRLGVVLSFVCVWPWVAYMATPVAIVMGQLPTYVLVGGTATGYVLSTAATVFAVTRGGLFEAAPSAGTLGPETVLENLEDAVVVVDHDQRVVRMNAAAEVAFDTTLGDAAGRPLSGVVGLGLDELRASEGVELDVAEGGGDFEATVSPVTDRHGRSPGYAVVLSDVTLQRVRAQRLGVLNRVLRHNLRNEMSRIVGRAEVIAEEADEHGDTAERILEGAHDLVDLGDRAQQVEEMMSYDPAPGERASVADVAEAVAAGYREAHPDAAVTVDVEPSLSVPVDGRLLERVLDNLVENAIEHNDAPTPVVTVSARVDDEDDDLVRLWVADNGPGLPEPERAVLSDGEETPLQHGSGLGLWAVAWGVRRMGGALDFTENRPRGTVVGVRLPRAEHVDTPAFELRESEAGTSEQAVGAE